MSSPTLESPYLLRKGVTSPDFGRHVPRWLRGPGRPGWLPTQVPLRSGLAHHAHPVPHLLNSRPARSVVGTWTWFRSRCTCQVSLQRLMRRHPLPLTGFLGLVPPLQRYYEVLRLPAAHFAALRFLRLAIPSLRPLFVPPGPGRGAVDQSGVGRRYLQAWFKRRSQLRGGWGRRPKGDAPRSEAGALGAR